MGNGIPPEPWTTSIEFTVHPTDDPDVVTVKQGELRYRTITRAEAHEFTDPHYQAARAYFDAHPALLAHPLKDAKVGEWWAVTGGQCGIERVVHIDDRNPLLWPNVVSARQVYVIPKENADNVVKTARDGFSTDAVAAILAAAL